MEGLIPFLIHAVKKQKPQNLQRSLSDKSTTGRSYHLLLGGESVEGSSHRRTRSDFQLPLSTTDLLPGYDNLKSFSPRPPTTTNTGNGLRQRASTSASQYPLSR